MRFDPDHWSLQLEHESVGTLPEIPAYADWDQLLTAWTTRCLARHPATSSADPIPELANLANDLSQGSAEQVLAALGQINRLASKRALNPAHVSAAAEGSVWLVVQTYDALQLSDPLIGHTVALVALSKALEPDRIRSDDALLLRTMGYEAAARAKQLQSAAAMGLWEGRTTAGAYQTAAIGTARAQYLELLDLARGRGPVRWWTAFRSRGGVAGQLRLAEGDRRARGFRFDPADGRGPHRGGVPRDHGGQRRARQVRGAVGSRGLAHEPLSSYLAVRKRA
jgi:hypothetical protein